MREGGWHCGGEVETASFRLVAKKLSGATAGMAAPDSRLGGSPAIKANGPNSTNGPNPKGTSDQRPRERGALA